MGIERQLDGEGVQLTHIPTSASLGEAQRQGDVERERLGGDTGTSLVTTLLVQLETSRNAS